MAVTFDAAGAGYSAGGATASWAHTIAGNAILVGIACNVATPTVKVGTTSMTQVGSSVLVGGVFNYSVFALLSPPTGAQTINVTGASLYLIAESVSYSGVSSIGSLVSTTGSGTALSHSVSSATGQMVFNVMGAGADGAFSAYNQTSRFNAGTPSQTPPMLIGDAAGATTVSFSATHASAGWCSLAVTIIPLAVAPTGTIASALQKALFSSGTGVQSQSGTIAASLQKTLFAGNAAQAQSGSVSALLQAAVMAATGTQAQSGTVAALLRAAVFASSGVMQPTGQIVSQLPPAVFAASGGQSQQGAATIVLQPAVASISGSQSQLGTIAVTARAAVVNMEYVPASTIVARLATATAALTAQQIISGSVAALMQPARADLAGVFFHDGTLTAAVRSALMAASGSQVQSGTISAVMNPAVFAGAGAHIIGGIIAALLQPATADVTAAGAVFGALGAHLFPALFHAIGNPLARPRAIADVLRELRSAQILGLDRIAVVAAVLRSTDVTRLDRRGGG